MTRGERWNRRWRRHSTRFGLPFALNERLDERTQAQRGRLCSTISAPATRRVFSAAVDASGRQDRAPYQLAWPCQPLVQGSYHGPKADQGVCLVEFRRRTRHECVPRLLRSVFPVQCDARSGEFSGRVLCGSSEETPLRTGKPLIHSNTHTACAWASHVHACTNGPWRVHR